MQRSWGCLSYVVSDAARKVRKFSEQPRPWAQEQVGTENEWMNVCSRVVRWEGEREVALPWATKKLKNVAKVLIGFCRPLKKFCLQIYLRPPIWMAAVLLHLLHRIFTGIQGRKETLQVLSPERYRAAYMDVEKRGCLKGEKKRKCLTIPRTAWNCLFDWLCVKLMAFWEDSLFFFFKIKNHVDSPKWLKKRNKLEVEARCADPLAEYM